MQIYDFRVELEREDGSKVAALSLTPDTDTALAGHGAGIVVLAGEWGMTAEVEKRFAWPLAEQGFFVVASDLLRGRIAETADEARALASEIDHENAIADLVAAILEVKRLASGRIGVLGLDLGATIAVEAATQLPHLDAVVHAGGPPPGFHAPLARVRAALQIHRAEHGTRFTREDHDDLARRLARSRASLLDHAYPAADGFYARPRGEEERAQAAIAFDRTRDFFASVLT